MESSATPATDTLADQLAHFRIGMLTTWDEAAGLLRARPMALQNERFDGTLWFFTDATAHKVSEVQRTHDVCFACADPDASRYVSVSGQGSLSRDRQRMEALWSPILKAWFPDGLEDPSIALLRVDVTAAEYWDAPSSTLVQLVGFVKAVATGERYEGTGVPHEKLRLG